MLLNRIFISWYLCNLSAYFSVSLSLSRSLSLSLSLFLSVYSLWINYSFNLCNNSVVTSWLYPFWCTYISFLFQNFCHYYVRVCLMQSYKYFAAIFPVLYTRVYPDIRWLNNPVQVRLNSMGLHNKTLPRISGKFPLDFILYDSNGYPDKSMGFHRRRLYRKSVDIMIRFCIVPFPPDFIA